LAKFFWGTRSYSISEGFSWNIYFFQIKLTLWFFFWFFLVCLLFTENPTLTFSDAMSSQVLSLCKIMVSVVCCSQLWLHQFTITTQQANAHVKITQTRANILLRFVLIFPRVGQLTTIHMCYKLYGSKGMSHRFGQLLNWLMVVRFTLKPIFATVPAAS